jgi:uncharacterized membrane protein
MIRIATLFFVSLIFSLSLDYVWLTIFAKKLYLDELGSLVRTQGSQLNLNLFSALFVYILLVVGIIIFVLPLSDHSLKWGLIYGMAFGFISYGIYDFTNYAIIANWSLRLSLIDVSWGIFLCGCTGLLTVFLNNLFEA